MERQHALLGLFKTADHFGEGGFTRTVCTHDTEHLPLVNGGADPPQGMVSAVVGKVDVLRLQQHLLLLFFHHRGLCFKPRPHLLLLFLGEGQLGQIRGAHRLVQFHPRIFQRRYIEGLTDTLVLQKLGTQQPIGVAVILNSALVHDDHAIHCLVQHILHTMLNDDNGAARPLLNLVNEDDGLLTRGGV